MSENLLNTLKKYEETIENDEKKLAELKQQSEDIVDRIIDISIGVDTQSVAFPGVGEEIYLLIEQRDKLQNEIAALTNKIDTLMATYIAAKAIIQSKKGGSRKRRISKKKSKKNRKTNRKRFA